MVSKNELRVGVKFETDNQQLEVSKQKLNELIANLQLIQNQYRQTNLLGNASEEFKQASQEAKKLEQILNSSWNSKLGQLDIGKFNNELKQSGRTIESVKANLSGAGATGTAAFNNIASSILNTNLELKKSSVLLDKMALTMANTVRFGISSSIFNSMTGAISKAYQYAVDLDTSLNSIRIVSGQSAEQMEQFAKYANQASKNLGASTLDYTDASLIYYQQGLDPEEVIERTDITMKAANALGTSAQEVSEYMTAIWNNFDDGSKSLEYYADVLTALGASTASSSEEIAEGLSKFAAVGDTVGLSYEYATSALATVVAETRQSADTVGTAFKTLFARIQDLELGKTLDDGTTLGKYSEALEKVGINIKDQNGQLKDMDVILNEMGSKWQTLNKDQQVALAQNVAGVRQYTQLVALMDSWDKFTTNLNTANNATGALQKQQDIYMESTEAHLQKLSTEAERTYDILFDTETVNGFADALTNVLGIFNNLIDGVGGGASAFTYLGSTVANIFSNQIGGAISRQIQNMEIAKKNAEGLNLKERIADMYTMQGETNIDVNSARIQEEARVYSQISEIKDHISQEEYNQLTALQKAMGLDAQRIADIKEYSSLLEKVGLNDRLSTETIKDQLEYKQDELKAQKELLKYLELTQLRSQDKTTDKNVENLLGEKFQEGTSRETELLAGMSGALGDRQQEVLETIQNEVLTEEQLTEQIQIQKDLITQQEGQVNDLNSALLGRQAIEDGTLQNLEEEQLRRQGIITQMKEQAEYQKNIQTAVQGITAIISLMTSLTGIVKTLNDEELDAGEKAERVITTLLAMLPMVISNFSAIKGMIPAINAALPKLLVNFGLVATAEQAATMSAVEMWLAILGPIALVVAAIAGVVLVIKGLIDAYNADAEAANRAAEAAKEAKQSYEECAAAAKELKEQISDYTEALNALDKLTSGTQEYADSLEAANSKAKELIKSLGLYNDYTYKNGAIVIDQKALEQAQANANHAAHLAENNYYSKQISANNANLNYQQKQVQRSVGTIFTPDSNVNMKGTSYDAVEGRQLSKESIQLIVNALNDVRKTDENKYNEAVANQSNFEKFLDGLSDTNDAIKTYNEQIAKQVDAFDSLAKSTNSLTDANKEYMAQINLSAVESKYRKQITDLSFDSNGKFNSARFDQIANIINNTGIQELVQGWKQDRREEIANTKYNGWGEKYSDAKAWSREFSFDNKNEQVTKQLKNAGVSDDFLNQMIGTTNLKEDQELAKAYAKLRNINLEGALYANGKYTKGDETLVDVSSSEKRGAIRENIFSTVVNAKDDKDYDAIGENRTNMAFNNLQSLLSGATEAGQKYGADFSQSLLDYISNKGKELDLSGMEAFLDPTELQSLKEMTPEQIEELFGLTEASMSEFGDLTGTQFAEQFKKALEKIEWDPTKAVSSALAGKDAELEGYGIEKEDIADYSEYLMDISKGAEDAQDGLNDLADEMQYNAESAVAVAKSVIRMNNGIEKLADGQENWLDVLKKSGMESKEYFDALNDMRDAMGDLLDMSEETEKYLDGDFFTKNAKLIEQAAEGSADAIDQLRNAAADTIVASIALENGIDQATIDGISTTLNELQDMAQTITVGTELDTTGLEEGEGAFIDKCNDIIRSAHMTAEQATAFFESIGFEPTFVMTEETANSTKPITMTVTEDAGSYDQEHEDGSKTHFTKTRTYSYIDGYIDVPEKIQVPALSSDGSVPQIQSITKKATGTSNNYSRKNNGGPSSPKKSGGGGGGNTKDPDKMDKLEEKADRYHKVNTQIAKVENSLKKLTSQEDKLVGSKLIANLNAQWAQLNTQVANYNEKLRIAQGEQAELRKELAGKGAKFNADGTISNYMEVFAARQNYVNSLIDKYNSMSAEEQEKYKETIEKAKEDFKEFQEDLDRYDELISDEIPGLRQSIQDAVDQQIEINIKKFNMEVDITLNMAEAERDWNRWKAKVLDGVKETDILGNAQARLQDFSSYYNQQGTASIQVQTRHLEDTLSELKKMDAGLDNVYGDNRSQALEDLQTYYQQLMEDLEGVLDLQTEIHQAYLDMMDEAQEKFDEQLDTYEMIGDLLQNNMKIVQLVYGEDSYSQLSNYYQQEYDNNVNRLDFLRQQKQLWADQMELFEEGSEEWQSAKEKWMEAAQELSSTLVDSLETAREGFENTIKEIFQDLNNLVTNDLGLDYVKEEWDLINRNADEYLDTINAVAGIRDLESKYIDAINDADSTKNQQRLNALMESELNTLRSMDKISQADLDRAELKYQIALAQLALEDAQQKKTQMRLRRDSQGNYSYQYTADEDAINKAKEELSNLYVDLYNFDKDQYKENLDNIYSVWEEYQQKMAEAALINDPEVRAQRELLIQQEYDELLNGLLEKNTAFRTYLQESSFMTLSQLYQTDLTNFTALTQGERDSLLNEVGGAFNTLLEVYGIDTEAFKNMTLEEQNAIITNLGSAFQTLTGFYNEDKKQFDKLETDNTAVLTEKMVPQWTSAIQTMADKISGKGGLQQTTEASMTKIKNATAQYDKQVETLAKTAGKTTTEIGKGLDKDITKTQQLVTDNTKLITSYNNELKAIKKVCDQIDTLIKKYQNAESAAKKATEAAYKYWLQEQQKQAAAAKKQTQTTSKSGSNSSSSSSSGGGSSAPASPQGNGNVDVGDKVTLNGKLAVSSYNSPTLTPISRYRGAQLYVQMINNGAKSPYHLGTSPSYSSSTAVGWVDRNQISGYDTGGYTGEWDNKDGRLAVLHEKELVLNAKDTENMLNTVAIMRNLATTLGGNVLAKLAGVAAGNGNGKVDTTDTIEQNVHIDATFPGVKDAKEIEDALNNLVNSATQRIFEKR